MRAQYKLCHSSDLTSTTVTDLVHLEKCLICERQYIHNKFAHAPSNSRLWQSSNASKNRKSSQKYIDGAYFSLLYRRIERIKFREAKAKIFREIFFYLIMEKFISELDEHESLDSESVNMSVCIRGTTWNCGEIGSDNLTLRHVS